MIGGPNRSNAKIQKEKGGNGWLLTGMNITGNYTVKAIYTDEQGNVSEQIAVITRLKKKQAACDVHLINTDEFPNRFQAYVPDGFDGIVIGGGSVNESLKNVVDQDTENYVEYKNDLNISLINNNALIGVKTTDGSSINASHQNTCRFCHQ